MQDKGTEDNYGGRFWLYVAIFLILFWGTVIWLLI